MLSIRHAVTLDVDKYEPVSKRCFRQNLVFTY